MRVLERTGLVTALLFVAAGVAEAKGPPPKTISVDCSRGQTIGDALFTPAGGLVIEFSGTCAEDVVIERDDVTLQGATPAASITGGAAAPSPAPAVVVRGAQRVTLRGFTARDSDSRGIQIEEGAAVRIDSLAVDGNVGGGLIVLTESFAFVRNSSFDGNGSDGVGAWRNSSIELEGTVRSNGNGRGGFIISGGSDLSVARAGAEIVANDNSNFGFALQHTSSAQLGAAAGTTVVVERNGVGLSLFLHSSFSASAIGSMIVRNSQTGISMMSASASIPGLEVSGCQLGVYANLDSMLDLIGARVTGNDRGVLVEAATALMRGSTIITGNTTEDLRLVFGSRVRFQGGTGGNISCDGTVLVRGDASCSASSTQMALSSNDDGLLRASNEEIPVDTRPFPLIP